MAVQGRSPPPKPWERAGNDSGPSPFAPPSTASTAETVASAATANNIPLTKPVQNTTNGAQGRGMPPRPWEQQGNFNRPYQNTYGGYGGYNGAARYGSYGGGYGGGGMYGGGGYGYSGGGYGNGMYGNRYGYGGGGYGMPMNGGYGGYNNQMNPNDPNNPNNPDDPYGGGIPRPPGFWQSMLRVMHGVVSFCGRLAFLIDENTQAFHFFMTALLQLCDRAGSLYGELARFAFRLLGFRPKARAASGGTAPEAQHGAIVPSAGGPPEGGWDSLWSNGDAK